MNGSFNSMANIIFVNVVFLFDKQNNHQSQSLTTLSATTTPVFPFTNMELTLIPA